MGHGWIVKGRGKTWLYEANIYREWLTRKRGRLRRWGKLIIIGLKCIVLVCFQAECFGMCVCVCVCFCVCMYIYIYIYTYTNTCLCVCVCVYIYIYTYIHTQTHTHDCEMSGNTKREKETVNFQVEFFDSKAFKTVHCCLYTAGTCNMRSTDPLNPFFLLSRSLLFSYEPWRPCMMISAHVDLWCYWFRFFAWTITFDVLSASDETCISSSLIS